MNWYERWHEIGREGAKRQEEFDKKYFNMDTYAGTLRGLLVCVIAWYALWHFYDIMDWYQNLTGGRQSDPVKPNQIRWIRQCASAMCGMGVLAHVVALIKIPINRRRAQNQAQESAAQASNSDAETPQE